MTLLLNLAKDFLERTIKMTDKELEEKLDSLYDPKMMTFSVNELADGSGTVVSNYFPLTGTSTSMVKIGYKHDEIEIAIAYLAGQIDGYKERQQKPDDFAAVIKALESIKDFAEERLEKDNE